jgi:hypothetical protein
MLPLGGFKYWGRHKKKYLWGFEINIALYVCERISTQNSEKADNHHVCFNNYNGPSTAMEADVILDWFRKSVDMDGLIYGKLIGDEDSSVYKKRLHRTVLSSTSKKLSARTTF